MRALLAALLLPAVLSACATQRIDMIQVGPWFKSRAPKQVEVFSSREEATRPWGAIALFHGPHVSGRDASAFKKQMKKARRMAADIGADAIIVAPEAVNRTDVPLGPGEGAGGSVFLTGLAIKYADNVSSATKRAQ